MRDSAPDPVGLPPSWMVDSGHSSERFVKELYAALLLESWLSHLWSLIFSQLLNLPVPRCVHLLNRANNPLVQRLAGEKYCWCSRLL